MRHILGIIIILILFLSSCREVKTEPSLIPLPQSVTFTGTQFPLSGFKQVVTGDQTLQKQAEQVKELLNKNGEEAVITGSGKTGEPSVELKLATLQNRDKEAYQLSVTRERIRITANTGHGIFNGIQTLRQLIRGTSVYGCEITDVPAFSWRGYMVDVGRTYMSVDLLKQQIDVMAAYKLNTFHFHVTEDLAWRLQIQKYPQLTAPEHMQRDPGKFYSEEDVKDLIQYCRDRFINFVIELDMPGHSAAFARAMGTDMQSATGVEAVKNILEEVCTTYNISHIHIGADEVHIWNEQFLPEVISLIRRHGKQVIGWAPGGNYDDQTIRQLWRWDAKPDSLNSNARYIDSRYLYLSDLDPMNTVVSIFNRQMGGQTAGDSRLLGAEVCLWDDRKVEKDKDRLTMTAVYPSMLAFSERTWRGEGHPGVSFMIGPDSSERAKDFAAFEKRLIDHKQNYFTGLPFQYVRQTHIHWKLFGPFQNDGKLETSFWPEDPGISLGDSAAAIRATGGTIWLRHADSPSVTSAWIPDPETNTTWYAYTRFRSRTDTTLDFWLETKTLSRSGADATPPAGEWDYMKSRIWVNGVLIPPPRWAFPGRPSDLLEEPMVDEGFYYRPPVPVKVRKGWNEVLVKLPWGNKFIWDNWQTPPKWMFTFIPVHPGKGMNMEADDLIFSPDRIQD
ncbi:MAG: family 20 glycosylhydrolase [Mangrovibacterium sp.]